MTDNKWILETERLPEEGKGVIVLSLREDGTWFMGYGQFYNDSWNAVDASGAYRFWNLDVTHWQPLPELPEADDE